ncbi:MAG: 3'-5' exonuclease, partial [Gammaproteobacteria bacterium]|nr:3'-5' exonuclease [Gammaproteobacteria bacterium]
RHIAAVTFTNKAAREMKSRVSELLKNQNTRGLAVSTFHTLGLNILRQEAPGVGLRSGFSIFDDQDTQELLRETAQRACLSDGDYADLLHRVARWKQAMVGPQQALREAGDARETGAAQCYAQYERSLRAYNAVDFDDLIGLPVQLFEQHPEVLERWQGRLRYLLVDEYQDTNAGQYRLVRLLTGARGALTAVGDDDQSIYAWRGARPENLKILRDDFSDLKIIKLEQNYRSAGRILKAANALIANNPHVFEKVLWSKLGYGDPLRIILARDETHEADWVVSELLSHRFRHRNDFRDYAILYRGNHQSRVFEKALREHRVPYFLSGGTSFFSRSEIRDVMAYLRLLANPDDDAAFLRVVNTPRREIGSSTLEKLAGYARERDASLFAAAQELGLEQHLSARAVDRLRRFCTWLDKFAQRAASEETVPLVRELVEAVGYRRWLEDTSSSSKAAERRMQNVDELLEWLQRFCDESDSETGVGELVARAILMDVLERQEEENTSDRVNLMTLHAAKGLEFPHVFVAGMEEELLPHRTSLEEENLEEERRLAYVGITRAQRTLTFSLARKRRRYGEWEEREPSRFLAELPADDLEWKGGDGAAADPAARQAQGKSQLAGLRAMLDP